MRKRSGSGWVLGALVLVVAPAGCAALLGLDQFSESGATTGGTTGGAGTGTGGGGVGGGTTSGVSSGGATTTTTSGTGGSLPMGPWSMAIAGDVKPRGIAADSKGNVYITGSFSQSIQFEPQAPLVTGGGDDIFLVKLNAAGSALWAQRFGKAGADEANAIAVDAADDIVITGALGSAGNLGGGNLEAGAFAAKFDGTGKHVWSVSAKNNGASDTSAGYGIAVDPKGDVIVVGEFSGNIDMGPGKLPASGMSDLVIAKLGNTDGKALWALNFGGSSYDRGLGVRVDAAGNVALIGISGAAGFAIGGELIDAGNLPGTFVAKLDTDGMPLWGGPVLSGAGSSNVKAMSVDAFGKAYVVGSFSGTENYNYSDISSKVGSQDAFVTKVDAATTEWIKGYGDASDFQEASAVTIDKNGGVIFAGSFRGAADFGGGPVASAMGGMELFLTTVDKNGGYVASKSFAAPDRTFVKGMCLSSAGDVLMIGTFFGQLDFGTGVLDAPNGGGFIVKAAAP